MAHLPCFGRTTKIIAKALAHGVVEIRMGGVGSSEHHREAIMTTKTTKTTKPDWNAAPRTTWKRTRIEWRNGQPVVWTSTAYTKAAK